MERADFSGLVVRVRSQLRDELRTRWTDSALAMLLNEAQREYCLGVHSLTAEMEVAGGFDCRVPLPKDFIRAVKMTGPDGVEIPFATWRRLEEEHGDFRHVPDGEVRCVCMDFSARDMILFPAAPYRSLVGTLVYERLPESGVVEVRDVDAIVSYATMLAAHYSDGAGAGMRRADFRRGVTGLASVHGMGARPNSRRGGAWF